MPARSPASRRGTDNSTSTCRLCRHGLSKSFHSLKVSRLSVLQLVKVLMHEGDEPGCAGFASRIFGFPDENYRRGSKSRKCSEQVNLKFAGAGVKPLPASLNSLGGDG